MLVVGDETTLKVHLHTDEPELATALFAGAGEVSRLDVADMRVQVDERDARLAQRAAGEARRPPAGFRPAPTAARRRCAAVAVVSGEGLARCSTSSACTRSTAARR